MTRTRKLLTLLAMVAFIVIIFTVGYNQPPYTDLQIEFGRGRVWGLTPLGISLVILIVIYAGLFAIASDDAFLTRHRRGLKRLVIALVALCVLAGGVVAVTAIIDEARRISQRNAMFADRQRQRQAAQADWQSLTPSERAYFKLSAGLPDKGPMTDRDKARLRAFQDFVPEVYQRLNGQEVGLKRQDIFDRVVAEDARADWETMTPNTRRTVKGIVQGQIRFKPNSDKERIRMENLKEFVPEVHQPPTGDEIFDDPFKHDILVALPPRKQQAAPTVTPNP